MNTKCQLIKRAKIVPISIYFLPAGFGLVTLLIKMMHSRSNLHKAGLHPAKFVKEIGIIVQRQPAGFLFGSVRVHVIF